MNKNIVIGVLVVLVVIGLGFLLYNNGQEPANNQPVTTNTGATPISKQSDAPAVKTNATVIESNSTAAVTGEVVPNGAPTSYWYEYGETTAFGSRTTTQAIGSGFSPIATPGYITGLRANTQYYFRLSAENRFSTVNGATYAFTTNNNPPPVGVVPTTRTTAATNVARVTANLNGQVNPNGFATTYWFEYGKDTSFGSITGMRSGETGTEIIPVGVAISNLSPLTKYYFRLNAQNQYGTVNGTILNFTTKGPSAPGVPTVTTDTPLNVSTSTITFRGEVNPNGVETAYWFEYSDDSLLGTIVGKVTSADALPAGTVTTTVKLDAAGLSSNTKYYYRAVAQNQYGTVTGSIVSFTTKKK